MARGGNTAPHGKESADAYRIAVDWGGMFTDFVLQDGDGALLIARTLSTPGTWRDGRGVDCLVDVQDSSTFHLRSEGLGRLGGHGTAGGRAGAVSAFPPPAAVMSVVPVLTTLFRQATAGAIPSVEVARDVRDGLVSVEAARRPHGVILEGHGVIDCPAMDAPMNLCRSCGLTGQPV